MFSVFSESKYTGIGIVQVMYSPLIEQLQLGTKYWLLLRVVLVQEYEARNRFQESKIVTRLSYSWGENYYM